MPPHPPRVAPDPAAAAMQELADVLRQWRESGADLEPPPDDATMEQLLDLERRAQGGLR